MPARQKKPPTKTVPPASTPPIQQPVISSGDITVPQSQEPLKERKPWQFQPGNRANPGGRPKKGQSLREIVKSWADKNAGAIEKELDHHVFKMHRWDALQWALEWNLGKPAVTVERTSDEKQLAYAELQVKLLEVMAKRNGVEVPRLPAPNGAETAGVIDAEIESDTQT